MAISALLTLLAQAMLAVPFMLPFVFGVLFCGVYIILIVVNALSALVNGYRRQPPQVWLSRKAIVVTALIVATLICIESLFFIDGRFT